MATSCVTGGAPVVVIGAGLAGISAACSLADRGIPVVLCEKSSRLGGRAGSHSDGDGNHTPIGSHLVLRCCTAYLELLEKLGTLHMVQMQEQLHLTVAHAGHNAVLQAASIPHPLSLVPSLVRYPFLRPRDKMAALRGLSATLRRTPSLPGETLAEWLHRHRQPPRARRFLWELITAPTLNSPAEKASAELALLVFRLAVLARGQAAALGFLPRAASQLFETVGDYLSQRGGKLRLRSPALNISPESPADAGQTTCQQALLRVLLKNEEAIPARAVILAVPQWELPRLLPALWREMPFFRRAASLPRRPIVDVQLTYDRPVLSQKVLTIPGLPAVWVFPQQARPNLQNVAVSISCPQELMAWPAHRVISWTQAHLSTGLPHLGEARLRDARIQKHSGATFSVAPEDQALRPSSRTPMPGLFLAGDWTATGWPATMEGAVRSGINAAAQVP